MRGFWRQARSRKRAIRWKILFIMFATLATFVLMLLDFLPSQVVRDGLPATLPTPSVPTEQYKVPGYPGDSGNIWKQTEDLLQHEEGGWQVDALGRNHPLSSENFEGKASNGGSEPGKLQGDKQPPKYRNPKIQHSESAVDGEQNDKKPATTLRDFIEEEVLQTLGRSTTPLTTGKTGYMGTPQRSRPSSLQMEGSSAEAQHGTSLPAPETDLDASEAEKGAGAVEKARGKSLGQRYFPEARKAVPKPPRINAKGNVSILYNSAEFQEGLFTAQNEPWGQMPRVEGNLLESPFGNVSQSNPLCRPFIGANTVAIVGNGPMSDDQRLEVDKNDVVIRFNIMSNMRRGKEKFDVWITRFADSARHQYWGFSTMSFNEVQEILESLKLVLLLGGRQHNADQLADTWPALSQNEKGLLIPGVSILTAGLQQESFEEFG